MLRPFFLPIQSQPHFSVTIVSIQLSISGHDIKTMSRHELLPFSLLLFVVVSKT